MWTFLAAMRPTIATVGTLVVMRVANMGTVAIATIGTLISTTMGIANTWIVIFLRGGEGRRKEEGGEKGGEEKVRRVGRRRVRRIIVHVFKIFKGKKA